MISKSPKIFNPNGDDREFNELIWKDEMIDKYTGLANLNLSKNAFAIEWIKQAMALLWRPEEINMTQDKKQFNDLPKEIKDTFEYIISFLILLDSIVPNNTSTLLRVFADEEIKTALYWHTAIEALHRESYQYILKSVYGEDDKKINKVYYKFKEFEPLLKRNLEITKDFNTLNELVNKGIVSKDNIENLAYRRETFERAIFRALCTDLAIESVVFYVGFNVFHVFAYKLGILPGTNQQIYQIRMDENCFIEGTEVLTDRGFVDFRDLKVTDKIAQYEIETGEITFTEDWKFIKKKWNGNLIKLKSKDGSNFEIIATPDHEFICIDKKTYKVKKEFLGNIVCDSNSILPVSGYKLGGKNFLESFDRLRIAISAEGIIDKKNSNSNYISIIFKFKNKEKLKRLVDILMGCIEDNIELNFYITLPKDEKDVYKVNIKINSKYKHLIDKNLDWVKLSDISTLWAEEFIKELRNWNINPRLINKIQEICVIAGCQVEISDEGKKINIINKTYKEYKDMTKECIDYSGYVYCVSVPKGNIVVRYKNSVCITGNCHVSLFSNLIKKWKNYGYYYNEEELKEIFYRSAQMDMYFYTNSIANNIPLMTEDNIKDYIKWLTDERLKLLGISPIFNVKRNPFEDIEKLLKNDKTSFFETGSVDYAHVPIKEDDIDAINFD